MEERGNKTIMCSVFFLDIVGYSKKSVTGQISLKERFNSYLSTAILEVPIIDRIILDTGDGAAINFLGDIEDALKAALSLRESLLHEDPSIEHPLLIRMGINLGPVRLVRDINGQPNIVGDGINVAQRVMGFADASQILVSRSYYDAVSRVSPQYAGMFHYQGSRTDKHVREHEVYAIGYPGDKTTIGRAARLFFEQSEGPLGKVYLKISEVWRSVGLSQNGLVKLLNTGFWQAKPLQRLLYVVFGVIPIMLLIALLVRLSNHSEPTSSLNGRDELSLTDDQVKREVQWEVARPQSGAEPAGVNSVTEKPIEKKTSKNGSAKAVVPDSKVTKTESRTVARDKAANTLASPAEVRIKSEPKLTEVPKSSVGKISKPEGETKSEVIPEIKLKQTYDNENVDLKKPIEKLPSKAPGQTATKEMAKSPVFVKHVGTANEAMLAVECMDGTEVFVDGTRKGRINGTSITLQVTPGSHTVIVSHQQGVDSQVAEFELGKTISVNPDFCK